MNKKLHQTSRKYILLPIAMLGLVAILTWSVTDKVSAFNGRNSHGDFAAVIAQKFGLNQSVVEETIAEFHQQEMELRRQEMESRMEERLQRAVSEGNLTETQMRAILEKHDEMFERIQELDEQDLSPEDIREMRADIREEMQAWAEEQDIDFEVFLKIGRGMGRDGKRYSLK